MGTETNISTYLTVFEDFRDMPWLAKSQFSIFPTKLSLILSRMSVGFRSLQRQRLFPAEVTAMNSNSRYFKT